MAVVEILQGHAHANFHVWTSSLATSMPEMAASAEESREEVERVVVVAAASLLPLL
jgi:hypothetical protein